MRRLATSCTAATDPLRANKMRCGSVLFGTANMSQHTPHFQGAVRRSDGWPSVHRRSEPSCEPTVGYAKPRGMPESGFVQKRSCAEASVRLSTHVTINYEVPQELGEARNETVL
jgi:hypothetical protein